VTQFCAVALSFVDEERKMGQSADIASGVAGPCIGDGPSRSGYDICFPSVRHKDAALQHQHDESKQSGWSEKVIIITNLSGLWKGGRAGVPAGDRCSASVSLHQFCLPFRRGGCLPLNGAVYRKLQRRWENRRHFQLRLVN